MFLLSFYSNTKKRNPSRELRVSYFNNMNTRSSFVLYIFTLTYIHTNIHKYILYIILLIIMNILCRCSFLINVAQLLLSTSILLHHQFCLFFYMLKRRIKWKLFGFQHSFPSFFLCINIKRRISLNSTLIASSSSSSSWNWS